MPRRLLIVVDAPVDDVEDAAARVRTALNDALGSAITMTCRAAAPASETSSEVEIEAASELQIPYFQWFFSPTLRRTQTRWVRHAEAALRAELAGEAPPEPPKRSPLLPPVAFGAEQAAQLATLSALVALAAFGSALFGQYADFVADDFGVSDSDLGVALAVSRIGVLFALVATALADRRGRRRLILLSFVGICVGNAVSAVAPSFEVFTIAQVVTRGFVQATFTVAAVAVIEEAPEGARAWAAAMLALAGGAGFAISVVLLPTGDLATGAWRGAFALATLSVVAVPFLARGLRETHRYTELAARTKQRGRVGEVVDRAYGPRFLVLAATGFLTNVFAAPSSQLTNRYLQDDRGYSGTDVAALRTVTTGLPGLFGIVLAGRLAESRGRRATAAVGLAIATAVQAVFFLTSGPALWLASAVAIVASSAGGIALGTLDAELFPTEVRGTANALLLVSGVAGSVVGLLLAGLLSDALGGLGNAIALCAVPAFVAAVVFVPRLPESARRRLDDVSPSEV